MALPYDFQAQQAKVQQMQMMAQALMQQGQQPQGQMVSGRFVAPSLTQGLAALGNQVGGAYLGNKAIDKQVELGKDYQQRIVDALAQAQTNPNRSQAAMGLMASGIPELQKIGEAQNTNLGKLIDDKSLDSRGRVALALSGDSSQLNPAGETHVVGDQMFYGAPGETPTNVLDARPKFGPIQNVNGESVQFEQGTNKPIQTATRPPQTNVNLGENAVDKAAADKIMDDLRQSRTSIQGARNMNSSADRLTTILQDPKVITGFAQNSRMGLSSLANLLFPGDATALAKTQQALRESANLALDSASRLKGQGQVSDAERQLLANAAGGNLDYTPDALRQIAATTKRIAAIQANDATTFQNKVRQNPKYAQYVDMMELAPYQSTQDVKPLTPDVAAPAPAAGGPKIINWPGSQ